VGCNVGQPTKVAVDYLAFQSSGAHFILNVIGVANNSNPHPAPGETVNIYSITTTTTRNIITGRCAKGNINVLLTHLEDADDQWALDQLVERRGKACFDLLCGGHSHKKKSETINEAGYLKTGLFGTYIGIACIKWDTVLKSVAGKSFQLVCLENESPDPGMVSLIDSVKSVYPHQ
jgi:2',3'-cyclic-nucleotide 2'-phosphodiesterase (5'-nucleotidase family)